MTEQLLMIIVRDKPHHHYEKHFYDRVEFWTLDGNKFGESKNIGDVY